MVEASALPHSKSYIFDGPGFETHRRCHFILSHWQSVLASFLFRQARARSSLYSKRGWWEEICSITAASWLRTMAEW